MDQVISSPPSPVVELDPDFERKFKVYRDYIQHEDDLLHQRSSWNLTVQGFLFAAYGVLLQQSLKEGATPNESIYRCLAWMLPVMGAIISGSVFLSVTAASKALDALGCKWKGCGYFGTTIQAAGYRRF
jgi:hypothetical protein